MNVKLKSVQVVQELVPVIKRLGSRITFNLITKKCSVQEAVNEALLDIADDIARYHGKLMVEIQPFKAQSLSLTKIEKILSEYKSRQKNTRDWTHASKLINEITKALEN